MWWRSEADGLVSREKPELLSLVENSKEVKEKEGVEKNEKKGKRRYKYPQPNKIVWCLVSPRVRVFSRGPDPDPGPMPRACLHPTR